MVSTLDSESIDPIWVLGGICRKGLTRFLCSLGPELDQWRPFASILQAISNVVRNRPLLPVMLAAFVIRQLDWNGPLVLQSGELLRLSTMLESIFNVEDCWYVSVHFTAKAKMTQYSPLSFSLVCGVLLPVWCWCPIISGKNFSSFKLI